MAEQQQRIVGNQPIPQMPERTSIERVTDYEVFDSADQKIGSTSALWLDTHNQPAFIGVKTGWLLGKTHVLPAFGAEVNHSTRRIRIPCAGDIVKDAPSFSPDEEFDDTKERQVLEYYQTKAACQPTERVAGIPAEGQASSAEEATIPLYEEEAKVGKRTVEAGGVRLRKVVRTETVQQPVELKREELEVERGPASGQQPAEGVFEERDIYIPLRREEPVVEKQVHAREEVRARKTAEAEHETVSGQVRKEDVEVEREQPRKAA